MQTLFYLILLLGLGRCFWAVVAVDEDFTPLDVIAFVTILVFGGIVLMLLAGYETQCSGGGHPILLSPWEGK